MPSHHVRAILQATVYDVAKVTPLTEAPKLSERFNNTIRLKREDLQPVFSFKLRGAYNKISQLSADEKARGIICASAGNHAQGVAYSARALGLKNLIVMPKTTPAIKVSAVQALGGVVHLHGDSFDEANRFAIDKAKHDTMTYIAPYDDDLVIAGQGTIGAEILQQWRTVDYVFVAVGGGGLLAGVCAFLGNVAPHVKVIAVEPDGAACLKGALEAGQRITLPQVSLFADGVAVAQIGKRPFDIVRQMKEDGTRLVEDVITCTNDEICAAIKDVFEESRAVVETAGALAVAGLKKYIQTHKLSGKNTLAIVSGANMNFDRLRYIAERTEIGEQKEAIFGVRIPERTGAFLQFAQAIGTRNITEFNYRVRKGDDAFIFVGIALKGGADVRQEFIDELKAKGYGRVVDLTDDNIAKTHVRYLVGGAAQKEERLLRVIFPERPGALLQFLQTLGQDDDISLFHYRNHGAAEGRILVGLHTPDVRFVVTALRQIGYECECVSDNASYQMFLGQANAH